MNLRTTAEDRQKYSRMATEYLAAGLQASYSAAYEAVALDLEDALAEIARLEGEHWKTAWRTCPRCKQSWPHPSVRSELKCPSCQRAELEQRYQRLLKLVEPFVTVGAMFLGSSGWDTKEDVYRAFKVGDLRCLAEFVRGE